MFRVTLPILSGPLSNRTEWFLFLSLSLASSISSSYIEIWFRRVYLSARIYRRCGESSVSIGPPKRSKLSRHSSLSTRFFTLRAVVCRCFRDGLRYIRAFLSPRHCHLLLFPPTILLHIQDTSPRPILYRPLYCIAGFQEKSPPLMLSHLGWSWFPLAFQNSCVCFSSSLDSWT